MLVYSIWQQILNAFSSTLIPVIFPILQILSFQHSDAMRCDVFIIAFIIIISSSAALQIVELECRGTRNCVFLSTFKTMAISCALNSKWFKQFRSNNAHSVCFTHWWHSRHAIALFSSISISVAVFVSSILYLFLFFSLDIFLLF